MESLQKKALALINCGEASGRHVGATRWSSAPGLVNVLMKEHVLQWERENKGTLWGKVKLKAAEKFNEWTGLSTWERAQLAERFLTYDEYKALFDVRVPENVSGEMLRNLLIRYPAFVLENVTSENSRHAFMSRFAETDEGYLRFMNKHNPQLHDFFTKWTEIYFPINEVGRHAYFTGMTGSGKTELMKAIIGRYLRENKLPIIFIDPNGDAALQVAKFKENASPERQRKLVYVDPNLQEGLTPVINPFDIPNKSQFFYKQPHEEILEKRASQILEAFTQIYSDKGGEFTEKMQTYLFPAICVVLMKENGDMHDLLRLFDNSRNSDLVTLGKQSPNIVVRQMFESGFVVPESTKEGVTHRLSQMLSRGTFRNLVSGPSTIDLEREIENGSLIIFNLAKGRLGDKESMYYGKFIISIIISIVFERG